MNKFTAFFVAIGKWFKNAGIAIGKWFKNWFVSVDGKAIIPVRIWRWIKSLFVKTDDVVEPRLKTLVKSNGFESVSASVLAALSGILFGFIIMLIVTPSTSFSALGMLLLGGLNNGWTGVGDVLYYATPLILTGLSVGFAFKTGLFNIGASGQYTMGMFCSMLAAQSLKNVVTSNFLWVICILAGILGGMIWGAIPGLFKAFLGVNEVIVCIMTNYIGMYLVDMIIKNSEGFLYDKTYNWTMTMPSNSDLPKFLLDKIFPGTYANFGIIIAILAAVAIHVMLTKTKLGYEIKACGANKDASTYAGINANKNIVLAMVIAGALSGLAGAVQQQAGLQGRYSPVNVIQSEGFNGIAVALLGSSNPIGIIFAGIFFAHIKQGGFFMQILGVKNEIIDIIIGATIYFAGFAMIFRELLKKITKRKAASKNNGGGVNLDSQVATENTSTKEAI